ncbi:MAG: hypothetical protein FWD61_01105 [Phycisphaerales bacterium]|nr:hypothetical protein [Phycisphaerales bacterium]
MSAAGKTVVLKDEDDEAGSSGGRAGKRGLLPGGKGAVYDADGHCTFCCGCKPKVLGSYVTNAETSPTWDLTPYQGPHQAPSNSYWRLIELGSCYPGGYPWYGAGCVNNRGQLVNLPDEFRSGYYYNGYLELQIGCYDPEDDLIHWPGTCQPTSPRYSC